MAKGGFGRLLTALFCPPAADLPAEWTDCPLCGLQVLETNLAVLPVCGVIGAVVWTPTPEQLIAHCPLHRHLERAELPVPATVGTRPGG
jgi:hypothetical protein